MATTELTHLRSLSAGDRLRNLLEAAAAQTVALWRAIQHRRTVGRLLEWDDRMLRDIGLTQSDVHSALAGRFSEDPSSRLSAFSRERRSGIREQARERQAQRRCET